MIKALDPEIAAIPSSYGYDFQHIPMREKLRAGLRAWLPNSVKLAFAHRTFRPAVDRTSTDRLTDRHPMLAQAMSRVEDLGLPLNWNVYLSNSGCQSLALSLGYVLHRVSNRSSYTKDAQEFLEN